MKSTEKLTIGNLPDSKENDEDIEFSSDDEEDFLIEYEVLSNASTTSADVIETVDIRVTEKLISKNSKEHGAEDLEKMMHEMASMRENMRNMSDGQRREMAAQLAMRMASMFLDDDGEDEE